MVIAKRQRLFLVVALLMGLLAAGCGSDPSGVDRDLAPLVGTWRAEALVMTNKANPSVRIDFIEQGAVFTLSVLATGQYSATLSAFGQSNVEIGTISLKGDRITITPTTPKGPSTVGTWKLEGTTLLLDGETEFDFNLDGTREGATVHFQLRPLDL